MLQTFARHLILGSLLLSVACGGASEYLLTGTERSAVTDGIVTVEELEGNRMVTVELLHLPPPERVMEGATLYIAWIRPAGADPTMAGRLEYDEGDRTGVMRATTPHDNFTVFVTAEADATATAPSEYVVARQSVEE